MSLKTLNSVEAEQLIEHSEIPVIVDFFAQWCGPCKMLAPVLDDLSEVYEGDIEIVKVDIEEATDLTAKYNIRSVPTILFFQEGEVVKTKIGNATKSEIEDLINEVI